MHSDKVGEGGFQMIYKEFSSLYSSQSPIQDSVRALEPPFLPPRALALLGAPFPPPPRVRRPTSRPQMPVPGALC